jgi:hypothetical protein
MSHTQSKADIERRSEHLSPISPPYYRDRGYSPQDAPKLATPTQQRHPIEASPLKQTQKPERD